jgi:chemotaxis protein MotB
MADKSTEIALAPIIVIKKKKGHGGHHGGAWKVAYADFVTAMMALFIVLWLLSTSDETKKAVGGYFQDPKGVGKQMGSAMAGTGEALSIAKDDMVKLKEKLSNAIKQAPELKKLEHQVEMIITGEGLRIELLESEGGSFFESGRPSPTVLGSELIEVLALELGKMPNQLMIEGHTDAKPFAATGEYGNWELSSDRANAARRVMLKHGLRPDQVIQVRGFADRNLRKSKEPEDPSNRRVSIIVQYQSAPQLSSGSEHGKAGANKQEAGHGKPEPKAEHGKSEHHG